MAFRLKPEETLLRRYYEALLYFAHKVSKTTTLRQYETVRVYNSQTLRCQARKSLNRKRCTRSGCRKKLGFKKIFEVLLVSSYTHQPKITRTRRSYLKFDKSNLGTINYCPSMATNSMNVLMPKVKHGNATIM